MVSAICLVQTWFLLVSYGYDPYEVVNEYGGAGFKHIKMERTMVEINEISNKILRSGMKLLQPERVLEKCPEMPPNLFGNLAIDFTNPTSWFKSSFPDTDDFPPTLAQLKQLYPELGENAVFYPKYDKISPCDPPYENSRVAFLIKYRNRDTQLRFFLYYMIPILIRQQLQFKIYIIEQVQETVFNRAKLINAGYELAKKDADKNGLKWDCYTFHDVDLILENDNMLYRCEKDGNPRHLTVAIDKFDYKNPYEELFGGALQVTGEVFETVNGYSNTYWGWGGEDDDFYRRVFKYGQYKLVRPEPELARYKMFVHDHEGDPPAPERFDKLEHWKEFVQQDGLKQIDYTVFERKNEGFFERIIVDVGDRPEGVIDENEVVHWKKTGDKVKDKILLNLPKDIKIVHKFAPDHPMSLKKVDKEVGFEKVNLKKVKFPLDLKNLPADIKIVNKHAPTPLEPLS